MCVIESEKMKKVNWQKFDEKWAFAGQLGAIYNKEETKIRVWAPPALETGLVSVELISYGKDTNPASSPVEKLPMSLGKVENKTNHRENTIGVWEIQLPGDQIGLVYTFLVTYEDGHQVETQDPYMRGGIVNGNRSVIVAPDKRSFHKTNATWRLNQATDAIIEEIHVRDFSISESSGISAQNRGKYLGLVEEGSKNSFGEATGFDYLKGLGINCVQLMPVFDFATVDETGGAPVYNWGYDPQNYNLPEGSYSTDATDPNCRIIELQSTIEKFHEAGLNVIMDVVYNHMFDSSDSPFEKLVPQYYFRRSQAMVSGTLDTAAEREMFSRFVQDSVIYWTETYGFDGFRFDLMSGLDIATMNKIREQLNQLDSRILLYGEGWNMPTALPEHDKVIQKNLGLVAPIGMFNDDLRDAIKGSKFDGKTYGFVDGIDAYQSNPHQYPLEQTLMSGIMGSRKLYPTMKYPEQSINYVEAHDNYNLRDQLFINHPLDDKAAHVKRMSIAISLMMLSAGVPFIEVGQAFGRSKLVDSSGSGKFITADFVAAENSYRAGDLVNQIDWDVMHENLELLDFVRKLITIRNENPIFRLNDFNQIQQSVHIIQAKNGIIDYQIGDFRLIYNASARDYRVRELNQAEMILSNEADLVSTDKNQLVLTDLSMVILEIKE